MKNRTRIPNIYLGLVLSIMYIPILLVIIYSFNQSKISSVWSGFSLKWYAELFKDKDLLEAMVNSLVLATVSSLSAAVIATPVSYTHLDVYKRQPDTLTAPGILMHVIHE